MRPVLVGSIALLVIGVSAAGGYLIGEGASASAQDARAARLSAAKTAAGSSEREGLAGGRERGARAGSEAGQRSGQETGRRRGQLDGLAAVRRSTPDPPSQPQAPSPGESSSDSQQCQPNSGPLCIGPDGYPVDEPEGAFHTDKLPNGRPGTVLPKDQRSLSCVGIDDETGQCVGD